MPPREHRLELGAGDGAQLVGGDALGWAHRRDRVGASTLGDEQLEAEVLHGVAHPLGGAAVALPDCLETLLLQQLKGAFELEEQRDGRCPGRLPGLERLLRAAEVEVDARRRASLLRLPRLLAHADEGEPRRDHPALLRAGDHDVELPSVRLDRNRGQRRDRVDDQQAIASLDRTRDVLERVRRAGRGLVMGDADGANVAVRRQGLVDAVGVGDRPVVEGEVDGLAAVGAHEVDEALAEDTDGDDEDAVTGAHVVDDRGLHAAGSRGAERSAHRSRCDRCASGPP